MKYGNKYRYRLQYGLHRADVRNGKAGGVKVDCVITDPPYLIDYKTGRRQDKDNKFCKAILNDSNPELISEYIKLCYSIMKDNAPIYCFCNADKIDFFKQEFERNGFTIKNIIIWVKNSWTAGDLQAQFGKQYEMIIYANKGRCPFKIDKRLTDVWYADRVVGNEQEHQNQKPLNLITKILDIHTNENDLIFDGFMGSFTTAVACYKTGRHFIGAELDEDYFKMGSERLKKEQQQINIFDIIKRR